MTTIQKDEYIFEVDTKKTIEYYKMHSLCKCDCCENFYAQIKGLFPKLEAFLSDFGIDISKPDEIMSIESEGSIEYTNVDYTVCGKVITMGQNEIDIHDNQFFNLVITDGYASPNEQTSDYFTISVYNLELPWVLNKPSPQSAQNKVTNKTKTFFRKLFKA